MKKVLSKRSKRKTDKEIFKEILKISEDMHNIADIDILLDKILYEVRRFTSAEGGTIFMVEDNNLRMNYTQNDILFNENPANRYKYLNKEVPLDPKSIGRRDSHKGTGA